jgi:hypothetical protein
MSSGRTKPCLMLCTNGAGNTCEAVSPRLETSGFRKRNQVVEFWWNSLGRYARPGLEPYSAAETTSCPCRRSVGLAGFLHGKQRFSIVVFIPG